MPLFTPEFWLQSVLSIDRSFLSRNSIDALILDLDNTLSLHGDPAAEKGIPEWLAGMRGLGVKMIVVSNNTDKRVAPLAAKLGLEYVSGGAKPLTFGLNKAMLVMGSARKRTAVVGDQIFTDVLGGNLAGMRTILVEPFEVEKNLFLRAKRKAEALVFRRSSARLKEFNANGNNKNDL